MITKEQASEIYAIALTTGNLKRLGEAMREILKDRDTFKVQLDDHIRIDQHACCKQRDRIIHILNERIDFIPHDTIDSFKKNELGETFTVQKHDEKCTACLLREAIKR